MVNLIICVTFFYALHLFLRMSFSLHKVPFVEFTYKGGDDSGLYRFPLIRPIIWVPSIVVLVMMGLNLYVS